MAANLEAALDEVDRDFENEQGPLLDRPTSSRLDRPLTDDEERALLPWHRRPSPLYLLPGVVFLALALGSTMPSKLELLNLMTCRAYSPHYSPETTSSTISTSSWLPGWLDEGKPLDSLACRKDPYVQQIVANLILAITLITGILSALSTGFWLELSDRYGRARICAVTILATALGDSLLLVGIYKVDIVTPYFILLSGIIEGLGGGLATLIATSNSYCADSTPAGSRSSTFSLVGGCLFAGFGLGPTFGGFVIRLFHGNPVAPYFFSTVAYTSCFIGLFLIPEALSERRRQEAQEEAVSRAKTKKKCLKATLFGFLRPLKLLLPRKTPMPLIAGNEQPQVRTDWSLTLIACAYTTQTGLYAILSFKMLYAQYKFGWGPVEVGYLMSGAGGSRVLYLVLLLPLATRLFRRNHKHIALEGEEDTFSFLGTEGQETDAEESQFSRIDKLNEEALRIRKMHDSHFDLALARVSLSIETLVFIGFALNTGTTQFIICTMLQALGAGTGPSLQSLSLSRVKSKESGRILAALSVCQTLTSQVVGPLAFGSLYASTIKSNPEAIFVAASILLAVATIFISTVRLKPESFTAD